MDLITRLDARRADQAELQQILQTQFRTASQDTKFRLEYGGSGASMALALVYSARGNLLRIERGPALSDSDLEALQVAIASDLLSTPTHAVGREIIFTYQPVTGHFRYRDEFQILPVPQDAPRPPHRGGPHPSVLEVSFGAGPNRSINSIRFRNRMQEIEAILALAMPLGLEPRPLDSGHLWVYSDLQDGEIHSEYRQPGYAYSLPPAPAGFSDVAGISPISTIPHRQCYQLYGVRVEDFTVADTLSETLDRAWALEGIDRSKFLRACSWLQTSLAVSRSSKSSSYMALVTAIEALAGTPKKSTPCRGCGKPTGPGPTKLFSEFIDEYLPRDSVPKKFKSELYYMRSKLTHGEHMLLGDRRSWCVDHLERHESLRVGMLISIVRAAMLNWLYRQ